MRKVRAKALLSEPEHYRRNHESPGTGPIYEALRPLMNFKGQLHLMSGPQHILDHSGFVVVWENHRGETQRSHVLGTREKAEEFMAEILDGDKGHPSFAPVRQNIRVEPEHGTIRPALPITLDLDRE